MVMSGGGCGRNVDRSNPRARCVELNEFISCIICEGYLIDATTVIECLHSFCKTCIVKHLKTDNSCPRCKTLVHKTKPLRGLRSDPTLQDIVYKVVPGLYKNEMIRRKSLYKDNPDAAKNITSGEERGEYSGERTIYSSEDIIPISLQYVPREINYSYQPMKDKSGCETKDVGPNARGEHGRVRYFRCVSAVTIRVLKKLLRNKFDLKYHHDVQLFYKHDPLFDEYSILDLAYIYSWKRNAPLSLYYKISDLRTVTITKSTNKVPAKRKIAQSQALPPPAIITASPNLSTTTVTPITSTAISSQAPAQVKPLPAVTVPPVPKPCPPPALMKIPMPRNNGAPVAHDNHARALDLSKLHAVKKQQPVPSPAFHKNPCISMTHKIPSLIPIATDQPKLVGLEAVRRQAASILKVEEESLRKQQMQQQQQQQQKAPILPSPRTVNEIPLPHNLNKITQLVANIKPANGTAVKGPNIPSNGSANGSNGANGTMKNVKVAANGKDEVVVKKRKIVREPRGTKLKGLAISSNKSRPATVRDLIHARPLTTLRKIAPSPDPYLLNLAAFMQRQQSVIPPHISSSAANILSSSELTVTCTSLPTTKSADPPSAVVKKSVPPSKPSPSPLVLGHSFL